MGVVMRGKKMKKDYKSRNYLFRKTCLVCGDAIENLRLNKKFCSRKCYQRFVYYFNKKPIIDKCLECKKEYEKKRSDQVFCHKKCCRKFEKRMHRLPWSMVRVVDKNGKEEIIKIPSLI